DSHFLPLPPRRSADLIEGGHDLAFVEPMVTARGLVGGDLAFTRPPGHGLGVNPKQLRYLAGCQQIPELAVRAHGFHCKAGRRAETGHAVTQPTVPNPHTRKHKPYGIVKV